MRITRIINNYSRNCSPCLSCENFKAEGYPECSSFCRTVNEYLISLGDLPNKLPSIIPDEFKAKLISVKRPQDPRKCSQQEYKRMKQILKDYQRRKKLSLKQMAEEVGLSSSLISNFIGLRNRKQERMSLTNYKLCVIWAQGNGYVL